MGGVKRVVLFFESPLQMEPMMTCDCDDDMKEVGGSESRSKEGWGGGGSEAEKGV